MATISPGGEVATALERDGLALTGQGLAYALMFTELEGLVCSGRRRGKQHTYARLDERVPGSDSRSRPEALAELARRYFISRGPASIRDLATWASLTLAEVARRPTTRRRPWPSSISTASPTGTDPAIRRPLRPRCGPISSMAWTS